MSYGIGRCTVCGVSMLRCECAQPEEFRAVPGWEETYEVSLAGKLRNKKTGRMLKCWKNLAGYVVFCFCKDGKTSTQMAHRVIWTTFVGPIAQGMQINHKNRIKHDNRLENLEVVTREENCAHAGYASRPVTLTKNGEVLHFPSMSACSKYFGLTPGSVYRSIARNNRTRGWKITLDESIEDQRRDLEVNELRAQITALTAERDELKRLHDMEAVKVDMTERNKLQTSLDSALAQLKYVGEQLERLNREEGFFTSSFADKYEWLSAECFTILTTIRTKKEKQE